MKTIIIFVVILLISSINIYSQDKRINDVFQLQKTLENTENIANEEAVKELTREYWFLSSRYDSSGTISGYVDAVNTFYKSIDEQSLSKSSTLRSENNTTWNYLGPKGLSPNINLKYTSPGSIGRGWISSIYVLDTNTIYAGAKNSGLWFTTNGGGTWENLSESEPLINGVCSILIDPSDGDHILLLTKSTTSGVLNDYSNGIFETFNHGQTWSKLPVLINSQNFFPNAEEGQIPVSLIHRPNDFDELFLLTTSSLYRKIENNNWEKIHQTGIWGGGTFGWNSDIVFDRLNNDIFFMGGAQVFKGVINGQYVSFQNITDSLTGISNDTLRGCKIGIADNFPGRIWFYLMNRSQTKHLVKLENSSFNYMHLVYGGGFLTMNISVSEVDSNIVYLGKIIPSIFNENLSSVNELSRDDLSKFESAENDSDYLHADIRDMQTLEVNGTERLYVGHDGGVAWGENANGNCGVNKFCWHQISDDGSDGLQTNEFYGISISHSNDLVIQGGTQDCSSFIFNESTGQWIHAFSGDGSEGAVSQNNKNMVIAGAGCCPTPGSYILYDISNTSVYDYLGSVPNTSLHSRTLLDPVDSDVLWIGGSKLNKIDNCFSTSNNSRSTENTPVNTQISALAIGHNDNSIKYIAERIEQYGVSNSNHMWRYNPGTSSWVDISTNLSQYSNSYVTDIVTNPENDYEVWICMGQTMNHTNKVFHSTDGGSNWSSLSLGYPSGIPANRLIYDHVSSYLYVATDVGVFKWEVFRPENGWAYLTETMSLKIVTDIERDYVNHRLILGTYGRGIWEGILPDDECYIETPLNISNSISWDSPNTICQNVYVKNSGNLTISSDINLSKGATIYIENGGYVTINGGILYNGKCMVYNGGSLTILNNGSIELTNGDEFNSETGAIINLSYGSVVIN